MNDSTFYILTIDALSKECKRLCDFTNELDKNPAEKKKHIAEYKCAKYRYASLSLIHSTVQNNQRCRKAHNLKEYHHLLLPFDEILRKHRDYIAAYDSAPEDEKPDFSLYYAMTAFAQEEIEKLTDNMPLATDWERVELEERLGGFYFAKECLDEAWNNRKEASL
ncbi:MAG: hypothetical protein IJY47_00655 [Clostridia bacterium]|nr:hypothetical protein [Clostridia bacterium]